MTETWQPIGDVVATVVQKLAYGRAPSDWTDARVWLLKELNDKGSNAWIAAEINRMTGSNFSRNAVIGKRSRMGFIVPGHQAAPRYYRRVVREVDEPNAEFLGLTFAELEPGQCRYPRGDDPQTMLFCGQPVQEGSSYCVYCHKVCWVKPARHKKEKQAA